MIGYYGPYFALKMYVLITDIFDAGWSKIYSIIHKPLMKEVNTVVGIMISTTLLNCPPRTMVDVCPNENVTFWLFNKNLVEPFQMKEDNVSSLSNAPFIYNTPIKILLHGYTGHRDHDPNPQIRPNYLAIGYNVISVDYEAVARKPCYFQAAENSKTVGTCLGSFIDTLLKNNKNLNIQWFHIIAFSLGAHVGVYSGLHLREHGMELPRLTILDPAAPLFYKNENFITIHCAKFIDAIHTNAGIFGKTSRVGHIDFYVNYLLFQRGCSVFNISCNHLRAPIYFAESIVSKVGFWGYPLNEADSTELMGEYTPDGAKGIYYISTNYEPPYATGLSFPSDVDNIKQNLSNFANKYIMGILRSLGLPDMGMVQVLPK